MRCLAFDQYRIDLERLDVMCDENESACDLSIHSFVNIRELPTYGALHVCEHEEVHLKREEEVELNALCIQLQAFREV